MMRIASKALLVTALFMNWGAAAITYPGAQSRVQDSVPSGTALADTEPTLPPLAFVQFCSAYREQCVRTDTPSPISLDAQAWADLKRVNQEVNDTIAPDPSKGSSDWSLITRTGNCNDYAVQKRDALIRLGYPMAALSLAVVQTAFGEGHLVLTVRTDRGDFVLDNRRAPIVAWNRTGYRWFKRQSMDNPLHWVALSTRPGAREVRPTVEVAAARLGRDAIARGVVREDGVAVKPSQPYPALQTEAAWNAIDLAVKISDTAVAKPFAAPTQVIAEPVTVGGKLARLALDELAWAAWPVPALAAEAGVITPAS